MGSKKQDDRVRDIVTTASVIGNVPPYLQWWRDWGLLHL